jgi:hypothetical protein
MRTAFPIVFFISAFGLWDHGGADCRLGKTNQLLWEHWERDLITNVRPLSMRSWPPLLFGPHNFFLIFRNKNQGRNGLEAADTDYRSARPVCI